MPITNRTETSFEQVCAACGAHRTVANADVVVRTRGDYSTLELPPCVCGAVEVLLPRPSDEEHVLPGSGAHLHQLAVDELASRVCKRHLGPKATDELARWLPPGAALPTRSRRE